MSSKQEPEEEFTPLDRHLVIDESGMRFYDGTAEDHGAPSGEGVTMEVGPDGKAFFSGEVQSKLPPPSRWENLRRNGWLLLMGLVGVFAGAALVISLLGPITPIPTILPIFPAHSPWWNLNLHPPKVSSGSNGDPPGSHNLHEVVSAPKPATAANGPAKSSSATAPVVQNPVSPPRGFVPYPPIYPYSPPAPPPPRSNPIPRPIPEPAPHPTPIPRPSPPSFSPPSHYPTPKPYPSSGPIAAPVSPPRGMGSHGMPSLGGSHGGGSRGGGSHGGGGRR